MRKISDPKHYTEDTFYNANLTNLRQTNNPLQGEIGWDFFEGKKNNGSSERITVKKQINQLNWW